MARIDLVILKITDKGATDVDRPTDARFEPDLEDSVANPWQLTIQSSISLAAYSFHF